MEEKADRQEDVALVHPIAEVADLISMRRVIVISFLMIVAGVLTGLLLFLSKKVISSAVRRPGRAVIKQVVGVKNKKTFKDKAEGLLKEGGIDGEGQFHLERPGGVSQNVYLTSTTVDLTEFVGKKVRVWGETFQGEKAGWLMDVGLVEVL